MSSFLQRFGDLGARKGDDDLLRNKKRFLVFESVLMSMGGVMWGTLAVFLDRVPQSTIPYGYIVLTAINLITFNLTKRFVLAHTFQTLISLLLPFLFQWYLGGFYNSGGVMVWALLALAASLSYSNKLASLIWLFAFVILSVLSGIFDRYFIDLFVNDSLNPELAVELVIMNLTVVSLLIFILIIFYVNQNVESYKKLKSAQDMISESAKMSVLGQLSAGIAHEINTPLGAIKALSHENNRIHRDFMRKMQQISSTFNEEEKLAFNNLYDITNKQNSFYSAKEERDFRRKLADELESMGVQKSTYLSMKLVDSNILTLSEDLIILSKRNFEERVILLNELKSLRNNNQIIELSVEKASRTVKALKLFIHSGGSSNESFDVIDSIKTVLTIYGNELKKGVAVSLNFADEFLMVRGNLDSINQVWANLIVNACQAMNFTGELQISYTSHGENELIFKIQDNGPGISKENQAKIFSPLFSTKKRGEGSGLGLSIVKRIVEQEGGEIWFESDGKTGTSFFVKLRKSIENE